MLLDLLQRIGPELASLQPGDLDEGLVGLAVKLLDAGWSMPPEPSAVEFLAFTEAGRRRRAELAIWAGMSCDPIVAAHLEARLLHNPDSEQEWVRAVAHGLAVGAVTHATA